MLNVANVCIIVASIFVIAFSGIGIHTLIHNNKGEKASNTTNTEQPNTNILETNASANIQIYEESDVEPEEKMLQVSFLGEIMMGGDVGKSLNYNYLSAFKNIAEYTSQADYTVVNLATNIIDLKELKETKSKYIVTKNIENAFSALGVDGINIASDHMLDFGQDIFKDTVNLLKEDYDLIGLKNQIVYVEHNGIKIALIGVCNEVIGTESQYTSAGIMMYNMSKLKSMIKEAKQNVNTVVVLTHLGLENTHTVTSIMSWFYKELINSGADAILGSHALGVYPVEIYNGKPIVYSMSNLMSDTDYLQGKESGVFTLNMDEKGKIKSLEILPLYVNAKKQTVLYKDYNLEMSESFLKYLSKKLDEQKYNISDGKLTINVK